VAGFLGVVGHAQEFGFRAGECRGFLPISLKLFS